MAAYREVSFVVPNGPAQYCESDGSDRDTAAGVDRNDTDNAEEGESHHTTYPVPQQRGHSRQSQQSTESVEEGESHPIVDPVPQPRRRSKQSRQSLISVEEGESHPTVPQPRRRSKLSRQSTESVEEGKNHRTADPDSEQLSSGQSLQRDLGGIASDHDAPCSKRKKTRMSESTEPESTEGGPTSSSSKSAVRQGFWTATMVSLCILIRMLASTYLLCISYVYCRMSASKRWWRSTRQMAGRGWRSSWGKG